MWTFKSRDEKLHWSHKLLAFRIQLILIFRILINKDPNVSFQDLSWEQCAPVATPATIVPSFVATRKIKDSASLRKNTPSHNASYISTVYHCQKCNRNFSSNTALQHHIYSKHEDPASKIYPCSQCSKRFNTTASLTRHERAHRGLFAHTCMFCQKGFATRDHLQGHVSSNHTGERTFHCNECGKNFLYKTHLNAHLRKDHPNIVQ